MNINRTFRPNDIYSDAYDAKKVWYMADVERLHYECKNPEPIKDFIKRVFIETTK